ncbi:SUMF1/EgtB/PvdO family nonheme iron enzyme [Bradyrhizobium sp. Tv2a-2]|uniref:SUMF1/EgtB/PvdO family nonheme iron enzyme n=1 Tax=Bradyrhizobium sp. Tv2a-2 TaxID=113395 RepID=UPI0004051F90|nr:SUMF1/EgtB/PvdO family nonheme iron enzyme [Bradyrhizobium sp. Tv2a-2]
MLIAFKLKLALACVAGLACPFAVAPLVSDHAMHNAAALRPAMVELAPGALSYRAAGEFTRDGKVVEAPLLSIHVSGPLSIMQHQVSSADYQACVDDGVCHALAHDVVISPERPAVQVNWHDASAYAAWLSRKTGGRYRLPTDQEWALAARSRFLDDGVTVDAANPAQRWIARYDREAVRDADTATRSFGTFGINENGLSDLSGNVWEWTATCFTRSVLGASGAVAKTNANCGVRIAEGAHRAYVTDFIRDARAGGCAAGTPPDNLGFRLVRDEPSFAARIAERFGKTFFLRG